MYDLWVMFRICVPLGLTIVCGKNKHCNTSLLLQVYNVICGVKFVVADMGQTYIIMNRLQQKHLKL